MKHIAFELWTRLVMVLLIILYPIFAVIALPWALLDSVGSWGHTTFQAWKEGWNYYSPASLKAGWRALVGPLRLKYPVEADESEWLA